MMAEVGPTQGPHVSQVPQCAGPFVGWQARSEQATDAWGHDAVSESSGVVGAERGLLIPRGRRGWV